MVRPIIPSKASISLTRWPFPMPPMDGLQLSSPIVSKRCVTSTVFAPVRAAAVAASQPACPPPTTTTSARSGNVTIASAYALVLRRRIRLDVVEEEGCGGGRPAPRWRKAAATRRRCSEDEKLLSASAACNIPATAQQYKTSSEASESRRRDRSIRIAREDTNHTLSKRYYRCTSYNNNTADTRADAGCAVYGIRGRWCGGECAF